MAELLLTIYALMMQGFMHDAFLGGVALLKKYVLLSQLQMIIERFFMGGDVDQSVEVGYQQELSVVEENAIYHAAGYVIRKLIKKFRRSGGENAYMHTAILLHMIGDDTVGDMPDSTDSFLDYVKVWTSNTDRGRLSHVSNDTYSFLLLWKLRFTCF